MHSYLSILDLGPQCLLQRQKIQHQMTRQATSVVNPQKTFSVMENPHPSRLHNLNSQPKHGVGTPITISLRRVFLAPNKDISKLMNKKKFTILLPMFLFI